ncbi:hypothetical protein [Streptomyces sp. NPDC048659]|uniref:hypothetical protein n=1 Tax=Streptomyces sp. NPDC048659 TaxID=3155489 RepID=UPI0034385456
MPRLRPGAGVRAVDDGLVLHRPGATVRLRTAPGLPALWRATGIGLVTGPDPGPGQDGARRARAVLTALLDEHGLLTRRDVTPGEAQTAALASDDSWWDPAGLDWELAGGPEWTAAARAALDGQAVPARTTVLAGGPGALLRVSALTTDGHRVAGAAVLPHAEGAAVVDTTALERFRRLSPPLRPAVRAAMPSVAAAVAAHRVLRALAGRARADQWHHVGTDGVRLRALPADADLAPRAPLPLGAPRRTAPDDFGPVIDALRADWDPELGPWREPHPGRLLQMPTALAAVTGPRVVVGLGDTHDAAWVAAALGASRLAAAAAAPPGALAIAGLGDLGLVADLGIRAAVVLAPPHADAPEQWQPVDPLPEVARIRWAEGIAVLAPAGTPRLGAVRLHHGGPLPVAEADLWLPGADAPVPHRAAAADADTAVAEALRLATARTQLLVGEGNAGAKLSAEAVDPHATALAALNGDTELVDRLAAGGGDAEAFRQALESLAALLPGTTVRQAAVGPRWREAAVHVGWVGAS